ncbi:MAG: anthranilate phosphoribosyltransferase [Phycisphaerae bacterium]|nr:anthranilate phosphoribosyltransferase [Phycisphaerae bacterium]
MKDLLLKLCRREDLTREEARWAFELIMSGQAGEAQIGGLLIGLAAKGSTVEELVGAAAVMRQKVVPIEVPAALHPLLDTCGTGGDVRGTFNISTAAALIAAGAGVRVVKHGNRSASGKSGSADVLEHLGVKLDLAPSQQALCLETAGICFAYARAHHPAMKHVAAARTSLGIPTIFNLLGPLTNPARASYQLLGVFAPELTDRLATVLRELGSRRAWVVHADDGLDELSTLGPTRVSELRDGHVRTWTLEPKSLGLEYARLSDLQCQSVAESARMIRNILAGQPGPTRDIALLNAAAGLVIVGRCPDLPSALHAATNAVDSGAARRALEALIEASNAEPGVP